MPSLSLLFSLLLSLSILFSLFLSSLLSLSSPPLTRSSSTFERHAMLRQKKMMLESGKCFEEGE